ncbi:MAG TPA: DUF2834 domain-containing protein [Terriglobia bacterium]|nr:DUF2834 domain-containing protein [Terriglobia bacterium]
MRLKTIYLALCVLSLVLPYWQFLPRVAENGFNFPLLLHQLFANRISGFFGLDVLVGAVVFLVFMRAEGARASVRYRWLPVAALLTVGVALGLSLFLYRRELALERT